MAYNNGELAEKAVQVWAINMEELCENIKMKLRLNKPIKYLFTQDGQLVIFFYKFAS
jgi:hypothetical protein